MGYPQRLLTDDETIVREFHPHWRVLMVSVLWALLGVAVLVASFTFMDGTIARVVGWGGLAVGLALAVPRVVRWRFRLYVLTTERIIVRDGIISRGGVEIPLENINNVLFQQNVVERLLGYGDVLIESAGSQGQSRLTDIPEPEAFQSEVYRVREVRSLAMSGGGQAPRDAAAQLQTLAELHEKGALTDEEFAEQKSKLLGQI